MLSWNTREITEAIKIGNWGLLREFSSRLNGTDFVNIGGNILQDPHPLLKFLSSRISIVEGKSRPTDHLRKSAVGQIKCEAP